MPRHSKPTLILRGRIWHYRFTVAGRRIIGSTGESDRGRAESLLAARWHEAHAKAGLRAAVRPAASLDLAAVAGLWLAQLEERSKERGPRYVQRHKLDVRYILGAFTLPGDVLDAAWQEAMRALHDGEDGLSWRSLQHATVTLRHLMRFAAQLGAVAVAPEIRPPPNRSVQREQAPRRALSAQERDRVLKAMRQNGDARAARIWQAMAYTGLRRGELARLTPRWLDTRAGVIVIPASAAKSGQQETIPLHSMALKAIQGEGAREPDEPVFGGFDLRKAWARALARARVDGHGLTPHHSARHTYGTLVAQLSRGDVTAVQAAGRWRSLAMVQRYVHASAERARAAVRRL